MPFETKIEEYIRRETVTLVLVVGTIVVVYLGIGFVLALGIHCWSLANEMGTRKYILSLAKSKEWRPIWWWCLRWPVIILLLWFAKKISNAG